MESGYLIPKKAVITAGVCLMCIHPELTVYAAADKIEGAQVSNCKLGHCKSVQNQSIWDNSPGLLRNLVMSMTRVTTSATSGPNLRANSGQLGAMSLPKGGTYVSHTVALKALTWATWSSASLQCICIFCKDCVHERMLHLLPAHATLSTTQLILTASLLSQWKSLCHEQKPPIS